MDTVKKQYTSISKDPLCCPYTATPAPLLLNPLPPPHPQPLATTNVFSISVIL